MGYWQDVLAENPNILNPTLNTGLFRWWLYESFRDNKPMDLFVTELLRMRGSERYGGPAGFGVASQNDVPMAMKGTVVAAAFLGVEMKCLVPRRPAPRLDAEGAVPARAAARHEAAEGAGDQ